MNNEMGSYISRERRKKKKRKEMEKEKDKQTIWSDDDYEEEDNAINSKADDHSRNGLNAKSGLNSKSTLKVSPFQCVSGNFEDLDLDKLTGINSRNLKKRSQEIDRQLTELAKQERNVIKILLLGSGESGKSTLVKQMKIIHNEGFTHQELQSFRATVLDNLVSSMKYVLLGMSLLKIRLENSHNKHLAQMVLSADPWLNNEYFMVSPKIAIALQNLWADKGVRRAVSRGNEYELNDSAIYLFENMSRICREKYIPTPMDVLRARVRTTGIIETQFKINDLIIRMVDVGGQKSERRKWIQCFDDVRALLFVAALSGYDMSLKDDAATNRLTESFALFADICNNRYFWSIATLLFLNKLDLFREKVLYSGRHLRHYLTDYRGADYDVDSGALFVQKKFELLNENSNKVIYTHFTTATDTSNVQVVFQAVMDTIVRENLKRATLL